MINFLHTFEPSSVLATVGPLTLYWYGFFYLVAILVGYFILQRLLLLLEKQGSQNAPRLYEELPGLVLGMIVFGILGARFYHVLTQWSYYGENLSKILAVNEGGLAIHGALLAGVIYLWLWARKKKYPLLWLLDLLAPLVLLGQAIGRWGNYFNQELFGRPTNLPWGIPIDPIFRPPLFADSAYFHPVFLYESLWGLAGFAIIFFLFKKWNGRAEIKWPAGIIFFSYLVYASVGRVLVESLRTEPALLIFDVRIHTLVAWGIAIIGLIGLATLFKQRRV